MSGHGRDGGYQKVQYSHTHTYTSPTITMVSLFVCRMKEDFRSWEECLKLREVQVSIHYIIYN